MSLKLFRSTGYSSILSPGETRLPMHPGWMIAAISAWTGFVCNVALWRQLAAWPQEGGGMARAMAMGVFLAGTCGLVLSVLGWRKTLKPAGTLILLVAGLAATSIWSQSLPVDGNLLDKRLASVMFPNWASFLRWQVSALLVLLALVPTVWVWNAGVRRLPGPRQLRVNVVGALVGAGLMSASGFLLWRGLA